MAAAGAASSTLLRVSSFTSARPAPRTAGQRIPRGLGRRSAPSSVCVHTSSGWRAAAVRVSAAAAGGAPAAPLLAALLFDCDGVLVDTEKDGHRISFNETFAERELGVSWDVELYGELLKIGGGKERMTAYFNKTGWPAKAPKTDEERKEFIASLHKRKTELFMALIEKKLLPLRPGVQRLIDEALGKGVKVAVCSTSNEKAVSAIVSCLLGPDRAEKITIFAGDVVPRKKPDPAIYILAATTLGVDPSRHHVILSLWELLEGITLCPRVRDSFIWKWLASGIFSTHTAYRAFFIGQSEVAGACQLCKSRAPNKCRFFIWLLIHGRCWTSERLQRHGLRNNGLCTLCSQLPEALDHLLGCVYNRETWFNLLHRLTLGPDASFVEWWLGSRKMIPKARRKAFDTMVILGAWCIWNERNSWVFRGTFLAACGSCEGHCRRG